MLSRKSSKGKKERRDYSVEWRKRTCDGDDRWSINEFRVKKGKQKRLSIAFFLFSITLTATHHNKTHMFFGKEKKRKLLILKLPWE
jgi:hypothetical protein